MPALAPMLNKPAEAAPLASFRIIFGLMMFASVLRFWYHGWIERLYLDPAFHFTFYGFEFIQVPGNFTYLLFGLCALSALFVALGFQYRWAILTFFLTFTYIELMDKSTYLNHYYFISVLSFLLIFLPAERYFSIDAWRKPDLAVQKIPSWTLDAVKLLLAILYIYAGAAKLNHDWMIEAMPLKIWLSLKTDLPLIGPLLNENWVHYAFSWAGAAYDLSIPFLLAYRPTRIWAFAAVVVFHVLTRILFPIGMFPFIMIAATLIFFGADFHHRFLQLVAQIFRINKAWFDNGREWIMEKSLRSRLTLIILSGFFLLQILVPLRFVFYPGHLFWTEEGFRFSWRVMLMEKTGSAQFKVVSPETGKRFYVDNHDFLNSFQEKQMATQPDFILEYAHYLGKHFESQGHGKVQVYVESFVALNGRRSRPFIDPEVDLMSKSESFAHKDWILPFYED